MTTQTSTTADHADRTPAHRYSARLAEQIETRWQQFWETNETFKVANPGDPDFDASRPKFYCLDMFPYPSGAGLHVGHPEGYTATDIICRFMRMCGRNVLHPMGWDAFGLPAEQYAIQTGVHPSVTTFKAINTFRRQLKRFGFCYDWSREFATIDEDYYRWTQWIFVKIYNSWFCDDTNRGRPITELISAFESGKRAVRINPQAAEHSRDEKQRDFGAWNDLGEDDKRTVIDSYRLAYLAHQTVNWCPMLGTALANEEVIDGRSERGSHPVMRKPLKQWMFRITSYAQRLLDGLADVEWPESTRAMQTEWIGRSQGAEVVFALATPIGEFAELRVYTTRPDTLFGATYMVVAPEHPLVDALLDSPGSTTDATALRAYVEAARNRSDIERQESKEKTGVDTGLQAANPVNNEMIPIWVADYVLMGYGTGAIMAVPAHDDRDHEFAKAFGLKIVEVVESPKGENSDGCFSGSGTNINSAGSDVSLNGLPTAEAKKAISEWLESKKLGERQVNFRLRDWLFSRQRYWGEPFPVVFDENGHHYAVSEDKLPVPLPELQDYEPAVSDDPAPLLAKATEWVQTTAADAGISSLAPDARVTRETNTMPGWAGSCWYYLRYCDPKNKDRFISREADAYWLGDDGVDLYIGGAEHAVLHLLYARFWHHVMHDLGFVRSAEPFRKLFHQGLITSSAFQRENKTLVPNDEVEACGDQFIESATGKPVMPIIAKMSKALKNVVNPDDIIGEFGADTFRLYEMYMGPLEASKPWNTRDTIGLYRFLQRVWRLCIDEESGAARISETADDDINRALHKSIAKVTEDIPRLAFNTAIASMIEFVNLATKRGESGTMLTRGQMADFARILSPFAPHMGEEIRTRIGGSGSIIDDAWPQADESLLISDTIEIPVQIKGKVRSKIIVENGADEDTIRAAVLADERVSELIEGKTIRKWIIVPGRLVNLVV